MPTTSTRSRRGWHTPPRGTSSTTTSCATPRPCPCGGAPVGRTAPEQATGAWPGRRGEPGAVRAAVRVAEGSALGRDLERGGLAAAQEHGVDRAGDEAADDRGQDEQPQLDDRVTSGEQGGADRPGGVHRRVVDRDADQVDQGE